MFRREQQRLREVGNVTPPAPVSGCDRTRAPANAPAITAAVKREPNSHDAIRELRLWQPRILKELPDDHNWIYTTTRRNARLFQGIVFYTCFRSNYAVLVVSCDILRHLTVTRMYVENETSENVLCIRLFRAL